MITNEYYKNEGLSLASDSIRMYENHIKVFKIV